MNLQETLALTEARGIKLRVDGDNLAFRAPRGTLTPELRLALSEHKTALIALLQPAAAGGAAITRVARDDGAPRAPSAGEARLWFLDQLAPGSVAYNMYVGLRMRGPLDVTRLGAGLTAVIARHDQLRATFVERDGQLTVAIAPPAAWQQPVIALPADGDRAAALARVVDELASPGYDLARGPLARIALAAIAADDHLLLIGMHHTIGDAASFVVFARDLFAYYTGDPPAELPVGYADFVHWQAQWLASPELAEAERWWARQLAGVPRLELPTLVGAGQPGGDAFSFALSPALTGALKELARREGTTLFVVVLAVWTSLLARYSGQADFAIGTVSAGRDRPELAGLIGFLPNTLVLRCDLSGDPDTKTLLARLRTTVAEALAHEDVPFERVVQAVGTPRGRDLNPLFRASCVLESVPVPRMQAAGVTWTSEPLRLDGSVPGTNRFELGLSLAERDGALGAVLEYAPELFDAAAIARLAEHYQTLAAAMVAAPERRARELDILSPGERALLLRRAEIVEAAPDLRTIHGVFEAQATRRPEAMAVVCNGAGLRYGELDARANQLAHHLRRLGVAPGVNVALCVERSLDMVVAILGVLKAGGAYVPVEPAHPAERIGFVLEDARAPVLVTQRALVGRMASYAGQRVVLDDGDDAAVIAAQPATRPAVAIDAGTCAYVIFTSGSTGRPKGVGVDHRNVVRLFTASDAWFGFGERDVWTLFHSYAFDFSVWEIWGALLYGGRLVVVPYDVSRSPDRFRRLLSDERVTILNQTPAAFRLVVAADASDPSPLALREVIFGGEAIDLASLAPWFARHGDVTPRLVNCYGITETTVLSTYRPLTAADVGRTTSPLGVPWPDTRCYVLDAAGQLAPLGVAGELCVGGAGVAIGYLRRPELTAARFLANPFAPGERLYRSGDLVRWLPDGELEFLGRIDQQVKIRGFRIELGEIEAVLAQHPAVGEAAVVARDDGGDKRLVAYVVARGAALGVAPSVADLRAHLGHSLPEYMVPSAFVVLDAMPLNSSGKVDRKALPAPQAAGDEDSYVAPRTPMEELVAGVWSDVLGTRVGASDDFFVLGGHSLLATQVISRVRALLGVELGMRVLFEAPMVAQLARRIEAMQGGATQVAPPGREVRPDRLPLSFAQQRLWFLDQLEPGLPLYNIPMVVRLAGALDAGALERALQAVAQRHEALRTCFPDDGGQPYQVIAPGSDLRLRVVDVAALALDVAAWCSAEGSQPFDLQRGPLIRASLLRVAPDAHLLVVVMHHIVADGWSIGVLTRELNALYAGQSLPALALQVADHTIWQRRQLAGESFERSLAYWKQQLASAPEGLELMIDRPRPAVQSHRGASLPVLLPAALATAVGALSRREGVTPFMTLLAAWQILLHRYAQQDDIVVGTPIAGRTEAAIEPLIGLFINTLALRVDLSGAPSGREVLRRAREVTLGAYAHQAVPFEQVIEHVAPVRDPRRPPVVQVMFVLQNTPPPVLALGDVTMTAEPISTTTAKVELTLSLTQTADGYVGELEYASDLFDASTIARMIAHYGTLVAALIAEPERPIAELPLLSADERAALLAGPEHVDGVDRVDAAPDPRTIHGMFEAQAARRPEAMAVVCDGVGLRYGELEARANQLAHHLRRLGVAPGVNVALCVERSLDMVVAILGVLKAGGAYVPVEPAHPAERIGFVLEDARAPVLVTQRAFVDRTASYAGQRVVLDGDDDAAAITAQLTTRPAVAIDAGTCAYVIFTSGSTGRPKGVGVDHRNVVRLFTASDAWFGFGERDVWTLFHSYAFDFSVWEIWGALLYGGRLVVVPYDVSRSPDRFRRLLSDERVTILNQTPAAFRLVVAADASDPSPLALREVIFGGEAIDLASLAPWFARHGDVTPRLVNCYGITETTVHVTYRPLTAADAALTTSPIGVAWPDLRAYVLDAHQQLVPIGVPGELYVGGAGVAMGYLNRPELNAAKFVADPFVPGARLYRSGDLVRRMANGELDYLGRIDQQVKIRGFRIELGEIEAVLAQHPAIGEAAVVARDDGGDKRLVAYVVARGAAPSVADLRAHLGHSLPEYMVPSAFVVLGAMPLNANGKVDRKALPAPQAASDEHSYVAPRTPTEELIAGVWSDVLGVRAGANDDFFALGGHSLLATQVISRVRALLGVELAMRVLFEAPTVAQLARRVEAMQGGAPPVAPPGRADRSQRLPLSFAQQRLWFLDQLEPGSPLYNIPMVGRLTGALDAGALERALQGVAQRHEVLRTSFPDDGGQPYQAIAASAELRLRVVDIAASAVAAWVDAEVSRPFDLSRGPLVRASLLRVAADDHVLVLVVHHIIADGWSVGVLTRELNALYAGRTLAPLAVQVADHAVWQRRQFAGEAFERSLGYWKQQLAGAPVGVELATDRPRPAVMSYRGSALPVRLPAALTAGVHALARREGVTPFMVLLAGWQILLHRYARQDDLVVGTPIAGRTEAAIEPLIGSFINMLALRADLSGAPSGREVLRRVREVTLGAYAHQAVPFEQVIEHVAPVRDQSRPPVFQVMFILQNTPPPLLALGDATLTVAPVARTTAKFELTLALTETADGYAGELEYATDLFDQATIARMIGHYQTLVAALVAEPAQWIDALAVLTADERAALVAPVVPAARDPRAIPELFEAQVARRPDAIAVTCDGAQLSYGALDARANQLAHHLRGLGVAPGDRVALCVERSLDMIVAIVGVLKAGAAYVPLESTHPAERLALILEDADVAALVTQRALRDRAPGFAGPRVVLDGEHAAAVAAQPSSALALALDPERAAYVMFTSGSTGRPKGVAVSHRNVVRLFTASEAWFHWDERDVSALWHSYGFDLSVWELWGALFHGGRLVVVPYEAVRAPDRLRRLLADEQVTMLMQTPSAFRLLEGADANDDSALALREVVFCGEAIDLASVRRWFARHGDVTPRLVNTYGPTEATVTMTYRPLRLADCDATTSPIGIAWPDARMRVLDARQQLVPVGVPGELYLGGACVAIGYFDQPALTAERFIADPYAPGERLYRTGDLVRWLPDGDVDFLGRIDHQVKIRGFRIELGEIEAALAAHAAVREVVVVARDDGGDKRLVAYVVAPDGMSFAELRVYLGQRLPEYMIPSAFVALGAMPLNASGKIDRKALPAPQAAADDDDAYVAPRTPTEEVIAGVWSDMLGARVGARDDFFALGGHSLIATQVISRVRAAFGVELAMRTLFEGPTVAQLAHRVDAMRADGSAPTVAPPGRADRSQRLPLSFAQQRLWFLDQLEPGSPLYNIPMVGRLTGALDAGALERALQGVAQRHEVLRTSFPDDGGEPYQAIAASAELRLRVVDIAASAVAAWVDAEVSRPFDLSRGPLTRASLLRVAADDHVLVLVVHHIIADGWSVGVLARELSALYAGRTLAPLAVQVADHAVWQRRQFAGDALAGALAYWKQQLAGVPAGLELATDRPRPAVMSYRGSALPVRLPAALTAGVHALARREGVTPFMVLLAAWQILLHRYARQDDVVVGTPIAGRTEAAIEPLIGSFINMLALRTDLSGAPSGREVLRRVREVTLGAYAHQAVPFEQVIEHVAPARDQSRPPVFQVMFILQNTPPPALTLGDATLTVAPVTTTTAKFELTLTLTETADGYAGELEYATDLFDQATIARMIGHYATLVAALVAEPAQSIAALALLTADERAALVVTAPVLPAARDPRAIPELFEAQVARRPGAIAVTCDGAQLSYGALEARANQLAHHLRKLGVAPGDRVALCVERSLDMIVAIVGVLKAGAAYVPLESTHPAERLALILEDADVAALVTQRALRDRTPGFAGPRVVLDGEHAGAVAAQPAKALALALDPERAAYVMFTSGSTGRPKGVAVSHRNVVRLFTASEAWFGWCERDVSALWHSYGFDLSVWELWGALFHGGRLVVVPYEAVRAPDKLRRLLADEQVTMLMQTPSAFRLLEGADASDDSPLALREVVFCGEAVDLASVRRWFARHGEVTPRLVNTYGPTEATVTMTYRPLRLADCDATTSPIGIAWPDARMRVLDAQQQLVPVGVPGELYLGGACVAIGYFDQPALTAERFIADPYAAGERLYRTGDLVRWLPDGDVDFLGRIDHQVKIRGFRIELGEIEAALAAHAAVREVVVVARDDGGDKRLVAYVVTPDGMSFAELRVYLGQRLPEYMIPSAFVALAAMPLNASGKIDRKALPAPQAAASDADAYVAPRTPTEEVIAGVWSDMLGARVGARDDFFALGGHSLIATQVISRVRAVFGVELAMRTLFEGPTVEQLAHRVDAMREGDPVVVDTAIERADRSQRLPLSFAQQRLWFLDQLEPGSSLYNIPMVMRLTGALDAGALERALQAVAQRHEVLRTSFPDEAGQPYQAIAASADLRLHAIDIAASETAAWVDGEIKRPFDLQRGPLVRASLLRVAADDHVLVIVVHHIIADGWSLAVLGREVSALYAGQALPPLALQVADHAVWQRRQLAGDALAGSLAYWKQQLANAPAGLELATDRPRPVVFSYRGGALPVRLPGELTAGVHALARREGVTPFMVLMAAWQILLHRYAQQDDIVVGTPIAGRTEAAIEPLIGSFINTLALRTDLSGAPSVREALRRVREVTLNAYAHQTVPFEQVIEHVAPVRDHSRPPVFQVMFVLQNTPPSVLALGDATTALEPVTTTTAKFELTLSLAEAADGYAGNLEYASDLFDATTIARMIGHYHTLIAALVAEPERSIAELALLSADERAALLASTKVVDAAPDPRTIHGMFEAQATRRPEAMAVVCDGVGLRYGELDARANQLAHHLRRLGVAPGVNVALCIERSLDMVVAILGVLKAGGGYVPVEPAHPAERIGFVLEDARAPVLVTQRAFVDRTASYAGKRVLLDADAAAIAAQPTTRPAVAIDAGTCAYVIFTSGSTGRPKGVGVDHHNVVRLFTASDAWFGFNERDVWTLFHSYAFDFSVWEIWGALLYGGRLVVVPYDVSRSPDKFRRLLSDERVTILNQTPAAFRLVVAADASDPSPLALREVIFGGEAIDLASLAPWFARHGDTQPRLVNCYGITETTVHVTYRPLTAADAALTSSPIGVAWPDLRAYVLDAHRQLMPIGVPGELYVGGGGVAMGYLNRPELNAAKFVGDPFVPGKRLYRSGDLVRRLPNGELDYLGRIDQQVKIRGFRIELGEIEAVLAQHPAIGEAVVVVRDDGGDKRLVAYVVARGAAPSVADLRAHLGQSLPEYMVPSAFVTLAAMPLNANGKVDRKALPAPQAATDDDAYVAPRTPTEEMIAGVWSDVLGARVGAGDDFFALGGHSLLATQVISRVRAAFGVELAIRTLFEAPTVEQLARRIEAMRGDAGALPELAIERADRSQPLALSFAQQRLWFFDQLEPGTGLYNIPIALRLTGALDAAALDRALCAVIARHEVLRTRFVATGGEPHQVIDPAPVHVLRTVELASGQLAAWLDAEARRPFELARGPLLRASLVRVGPDDHVLVLVMHHIISDGWSLSVLSRELDALYAGHELSALAIQVADHAAWQRQVLRGAVLDGALAYWKQQLAGAPESLELATDRPRPAVQSYRGASVPVVLPAALAAEVGALSRREGVTPFMTLLAAWQILLHRYTQQDDLVVGTPIAGRTEAAIEPLIGFFVNTLALRVDLSGAPSGRELLRRVREMTLGAYAHQAVPFEKVIEHVVTTRDLSRPPVFQVMFILQNTPPPGRTLGAATMTLEPVASPVAEFELTLALIEAEDGSYTGELEYASELFDQATIERMVAHYGTLVAAMVAAPERAIGELALLSPAEHAALSAVTGERFALPDACMHEVVAAQAARVPEAPSVAHGALTVSYRALDARANQLAHHLRGLGVGRDVRVALCFERSADAIVAQLGVLKAGGAYVPLDPGNPAARLAFVIEDSGAQVIVADPRLVEKLPASGARVIALDAAAGEPTTAPVIDAPPRPSDVAYVIYTSGSTGKPKGVLIEHRSLVNHALWKAKTYDVSRTSQFASLAFDASVGEIWSPLAAGGCVVIIDDALRTDPAALIAWLAAQRITSADLPTAVGELMMSLPWPALANQLHLWIGGDRLRRRPPVGAPYIVVNTYGPTECTVEATTAVIGAGEGMPAIGRPLGNLTASVLDGYRQPVPVGAAGELYVGGVGVARGYLDRPELTAARFVSLPSGERLYRTGDRCRWRTDGELEFLGRMDHQVKLRGFRIELGEIEHALTAHPAIRDAAVIVRGDRLVAYVVAAGEPIDDAALRAHLAAGLPEYMLPSLVVWLAALPVTRNGKLDRAALPEPAVAEVSSHAFTAIERQLNAVWADVLGAPAVDPHASFFSAGGHSLSAVMLVQRVSEAFGRRIALASFFQQPTLAGLAELVSDGDGDGGTRAWSPLIALERRGTGTPVFCVHPSLGSVASYESLALALGHDRPIYALTPLGLALDQTLDTEVEAMAARYLAAIREVQPHGPYLLAGHSFGGLVAFELAHQLTHAGEIVAGLVLLDTAAPGPAWQAPTTALDTAHGIVAALGELGVTLDPSLLDGLDGLDAEAQIERGLDALAAASELGATLERAQVRRMFLWHTRIVNDAYRAYAPAPYAGELVLLRASELRDPAGEALFAGWPALAPRLVEQRVPGDHHSMLRPPHVETLAAQLRNHLAVLSLTAVAAVPVSKTP